MAEDQRQVRFGEFAVDDVQIGAADAAGAYREADLTRARLWIGKLAGPKRGAGLVENHRKHPASRRCGGTTGLHRMAIDVRKAGGFTVPPRG